MNIRKLFALATLIAIALLVVAQLVRGGAPPNPVAQAIRMGFQAQQPWRIGGLQAAFLP
jgi:hypothetical protein